MVVNFKVINLKPAAEEKNRVINRVVTILANIKIVPKNITLFHSLVDVEEPFRVLVISYRESKGISIINIRENLKDN